MQSNFTRTFLFMLAGPLIWAAHFLFIYAWHGLVCARPALQINWLNMPISMWIILTAGVLALTVMAATHLCWRKRMPHMGNPKFLPWLAATLSLLSALAVVWETIPLVWIPACG
ncbi:hypothetical protein PT7_0926 [Pusillimonas sp. T7-7]|uniref:hypothetical protein n=1 Tax=Pusillimonas sp. (strain T7-7) TaxID=1007105 RepID=UPI0002084DB1|nr:hypothetical protein [Pusillimonas sp. T7-7]AEC19466.1 hypothetical protein PT7_0926 [Pusillimonas sp. T7-7]